MSHPRNYILDSISPYIDKPLIKVLKGLRRSGKSSILNLIQKELISRGIHENQVININFESLRYQDTLTATSLYEFVKTKIYREGKTYLFLDEVQEVKDWEKAINSFLVDFDIDLYITGSNSKLLSSELSTYLAGRYVSFHIQPLSFKECIAFYNYRHNQKLSIEEHLDRYIKIGGFPVLHIADYQQEDAYKIIYDIYTSTILRDTVQRHKIRNIELLERVIKFAFENMGQTFSANRIAQYFKSQHRKVDINTIHNYLDALESAFLLQKAERYDVRGKEILKTQEKYFPGDHAFIYALYGYKTEYISGILETIVYNELIRRGYDVYVGKLQKAEIDFVGKRKNDRIYIQVAYELKNEETIQKEYKSLLNIKDQYPKYIVSMENDRQKSYQGVKHIHLSDFLLGDI